MRKGTKLSMLIGLIPFIMLVFALPFVNRIEPMILGLPFLLFWIITWITLTPGVLFLAYVVEKRLNTNKDGGQE